MTKTVTYNYRRATKRLLSYITRALQKGLTIHKASEQLRDIVNSYIGLNRNERYSLFDESVKLYRAAKSGKDWHKTVALCRSFDRIAVTCHKVQASSDLRHKNQAYRAALSDEDTVFFLCSAHINPAPDHKDYQGKIYYDMFWRQKVSGNEYRAVYSYIKNHKLESVQGISDSPVYLTTRPYCRHYFIPLETSTVLSSSARKILESIGYDYSGKLDYDSLRQNVYSYLSTIEDCSEFRKLGK